MSPPPKGKRIEPERAQARDRAPDWTSAVDWTSTVVGAGLALLAVVGVLTVFSAPLMALVAPPAPEENAAAGPPAEAERALSTARDGGTSAVPVSPSQGGPDRDAHS